MSFWQWDQGYEFRWCRTNYRRPCNISLGYQVEVIQAWNIKYQTHSLSNNRWNPPQADSMLLRHATITSLGFSIVVTVNSSSLLGCKKAISYPFDVPLIPTKILIESTLLAWPLKLSIIERKWNSCMITNISYAAYHMLVIIDQKSFSFNNWQ